MAETSITVKRPDFKQLYLNNRLKQASPTTVITLIIYVYRPLLTHLKCVVCTLHVTSSLHQCDGTTHALSVHVLLVYCNL